MRRHKVADPGDRAPARLTPRSDLGDERGIIDGVASEPALPHLMGAAERLDFGEKVIHSAATMRRIYPSSQDGDGFIRKLCRTYPSWDISGMADAQFDIEHIKSVLREATKPGAEFSQRSLSKEAHQSRDCVGDIINGRNRNPTTKVLAHLADALGGDLSMFGLVEERTAPPTEDELEAAFRDVLPGMPKGSLDKRARYLAEAVARVLKLPQSLPTNAQHPRPGASGGDLPLPSTTR